MAPAVTQNRVLVVLHHLALAALHQHLVALVVLQFTEFSLLKNYREAAMKNCLIISDLSYLQPITESSIVVGGGKVYAGTDTITATGYGYALAGAGAVAIGETTYTNTQTKTNVQKLGFLSSSSADATAIAYARTGNQTASSQSSNTSISLVVTNH
jgi:hypothetical protein